VLGITYISCVVRIRISVQCVSIPYVAFYVSYVTDSEKFIYRGSFRYSLLITIDPSQQQEEVLSLFATRICNSLSLIREDTLKNVELQEDF